jgi:hypothetical protein
MVNDGYPNIIDAQKIFKNYQFSYKNPLSEQIQEITANISANAKIKEVSAKMSEVLQQNFRNTLESTGFVQTLDRVMYQNTSSEDKDKAIYELSIPWGFLGEDVYEEAQKCNTADETKKFVIQNNIRFKGRLKDELQSIQTSNNNTGYVDPNLSILLEAVENLDTNYKSSQALAACVIDNLVTRRLSAHFTFLWSPSKKDAMPLSEEIYSPNRGIYEKSVVENINRVKEVFGERGEEVASSLVFVFMNTEKLEEVNYDPQNIPSRHGTVHRSDKYFSEFNAIALLVITSYVLWYSYNYITPVSPKEKW